MASASLCKVSGRGLVVVDDDEPARESLFALLTEAGYAVAAFAAAEELLRRGVPAGTECLLIDVRLGAGMDGVSLIGALRQAGNQTPAVVITGHADIPLAVRAMRAGAIDFIEKPFAAERILDAVASAASAGADARRDAERLATLTAREVEVLGGLAEGKPNKIIAYDLDISVRTVEVHRANIMQKLGTTSLAGVVRIALASGLVR